MCGYGTVACPIVTCFDHLLQLTTDTETESETENGVKSEKTPLVPSTIDEGTEAGACVTLGLWGLFLV